MGLIALPYTPIGNLDVYGRPQKIQAISRNGYTRTLNKDEFVIMYDNNGQYPLFLDIIQYAERLRIRYKNTEILIFCNKELQDFGKLKLKMKKQ